MIGTHRNISLIAEVRFVGYVRTVVLCDSHGNSVIGAEVGTMSPRYVAQKLRKDFQDKINAQVMHSNAMNGTLERPYRVQCLFLEGAEG